MKRVIKLTENELVKVVKRIYEEINLEDYDTPDFYDAFFRVFNPWILKKLGDKASKYPISLLLKKYGQEFIEEMGIATDQFGRPKDFAIRSISRYGKELVNKSHYQLPNLYSYVKFTEKYKKVLPYFVEMLNLPPYINISFTENSPNRVVIDFDINYDEYLKDPQKVNRNEYKITEDLKKLLSNYAGVEFGNPAYGEVKMSYNRVIDADYVIQNWVKKVFNTKIKKKIKEVDTNNIIHSIKFSGGISNGDIELIFKRKNDFGFIKSQVKKDVVKDVADALEELGYGPNLTVSTP